MGKKNDKKDPPGKKPTDTNNGVLSTDVPSAKNDGPPRRKETPEQPKRYDEWSDRRQNKWSAANDPNYVAPTPEDILWAQVQEAWNTGSFDRSGAILRELGLQGQGYGTNLNSGTVSRVKQDPEYITYLHDNGLLDDWFKQNVTAPPGVEYAKDGVPAHATNIDPYRQAYSEQGMRDKGYTELGGGQWGMPAPLNPDGTRNETFNRLQDEWNAKAPHYGGPMAGAGAPFDPSTLPPAGTPYSAIPGMPVPGAPGASPVPGIPNGELSSTPPSSLGFAPTATAAAPGAGMAPPTVKSTALPFRQGPAQPVGQRRRRMIRRPY